MGTSCVNLASLSLWQGTPLLFSAWTLLEQDCEGSSFTVLFSSVAMEGLGFLDALNSAPVPGIKIKKKKKVLSPTAAKV